MLSPLSVRWCLIVDTGQEVEILKWNLFWVDTGLVVELTASSVLDTSDSLYKVVSSFSWDAQWMRAAGVGPHIWEGDLLGSTLLEQKLIVLVEEEDGECAVEKSLVDIGHKMT